MDTSPLPARPSSRLSAPRLSTQAQGALLGLAAASIWGLYLATSRVGVNAGLRGPDIAFIRYGTAALILLPWLLRNRPATLAGVGWGRGLVLALFAGPLFMLTSVGGYSFAPLAHGAVLQPATLTVAGTILAAVVLKERPTMARGIGIAIIVVGLVAIAGPSIFTMDPMTPAGDAMFISAGLLWAMFTIATKRWAIPPIAATAAMSVISAAVVVPAYLAFQGFDRFAGLPAAMLVTQLVVQGLLAGVLAIVAFAKAVQLLGGARAAVFPAMVPAVAIIIGVPMTGEIPTLPQLLGLALVSVGSLLAIGLLRVPRLRPVPIRPEGAAD